VKREVKPIGFAPVPVRRCLCFTNSQWPHYAKPFSIDDVWIGWSRALVDDILGEPIIGPGTVTALAHHLSTQFPASVNRCRSIGV
jgi:hypothetical protein